MFKRDFYSQDHGLYPGEPVRQPVLRSQSGNTQGEGWFRIISSIKLWLVTKNISNEVEDDWLVRMNKEPNMQWNVTQQQYAIRKL